MTRPPASSVALAVLSVAALAMLFGRAAGTDGDPPSPVVEPVARDPAPAVAPRGDAANVAVLARPRRSSEEPVLDLFTGRSWTPPPAPPPPIVAPAPPPAPVAPALPFTYVGRVQAPDEKAVVYLARGDRMVSATEGEMLDPLYRVESLDEDQIVFVFVPLGQKQVLRIDGGSR